MAPVIPPASLTRIIRLCRSGCANRPYYLMIVQATNRDVFDKKAVIEQLGSYDPMPNACGEKLAAINFDRLRYWLGSGAMTSKSVDRLLGLSGLLPVHPMSYIGAKRTRTRLAREAAKKEEEELARLKPRTDSLQAQVS